MKTIEDFRSKFGKLLSGSHSPPNGRGECGCLRAMLAIVD